MNFTLANLLKSYMLRENDFDSEETLAVAIGYTLPISTAKEDIPRGFALHAGKVDAVLSGLNEHVVIDISEMRSIARKTWTHRNNAIYLPQLDAPECLHDLTKDQVAVIGTLVQELKAVL